MRYIKFHPFFGLALFLLSLFLAGPAHADNFIGGSGTVWELPGFGNHYVISQVLEGTSRLVANGVYRTIVTTVSLIGLLVMIMTTGLDAGKMLQKGVTWVISVALLLYVFGIGAAGNTLRVNIAVYDVLDPAQRIVVQDVPGFIGWPATFIMQAGVKLTELLETEAAPADYEGMSKGSPFNLGAQLISDLKRAEITDVKLKRGLTEYVANCVTPMLANGQMQSSTLLSAPDVWSVMRVDNEVLTTSLEAPVTGEIEAMSCKSAYAALTPRLSDYLADMDSRVRSMSGMSATPLGAPLAAIADRTLQYSTNQNSFSLQSAIKQSAMSKIVDSGMSAGYGSVDAAAIQKEVQIELAAASQKSSWDTGLALFSKSMGYIFAVLQAFIIAVFPLLLILAFVPGLAMKTIGGLLQILFWLALWQPTLAVISLVTGLFLRQELGAVTAMGDPFLALSQQGAVTARADLLVSAASMLAASMPMLTWGLVKGTLAFTEFVSHGLGSQFAASAGAGVASGNLQMGNVSQNNRTANQASVGFSASDSLSFNNKSEFTASDMAGIGGQGGVKNINAQQMRESSEQLKNSLATAKSSSEAYRKAHDSSEALAKTATTAFSNSIMNTMTRQHNSGWESAFGIDKTTNDSLMSNFSNDFVKSQAEQGSAAGTKTWAISAGAAVDKLGESLKAKGLSNDQINGYMQKVAGAVGSMFGGGLQLKGDASNGWSVTVDEKALQSKMSGGGVNSGTSTKNGRSAVESASNGDGANSSAGKTDTDAMSKTLQDINSYSKALTFENSARAEANASWDQVNKTSLTLTKAMDASQADTLISGLDKQRAAAMGELTGAANGQLAAGQEGTAVNPHKPVEVGNPGANAHNGPANVHDKKIASKTGGIKAEALSQEAKTETKREKNVVSDKPAVFTADSAEKKIPFNVNATDIDPTVQAVAAGTSAIGAVGGVLANRGSAAHAPGGAAPKKPQPVYRRLGRR